MNRAGHCWRCEAPCTSRCSRCRVAFYCSKECQKQDKWRHQPNCDDAALKKQCSGCALEQEGLMKCTNCLKACYCSAECQRNDWESHKYLCQKTVDKTLKLVEIMKEFYEMKEKLPGLLFTYYWGNMPAVDLLNFSLNEGEEYSNPLALLLCGVGDPRNVLLTIASLPEVYEQQVNFVLNDICPCTLARTVLLLYMLYKGGNDITCAVVRIWYSVCITEEDFTLLTSALQDLSTTAELRALTEGVMELSADQLSQLKGVWVTWLRLSERKGPWVAKLRQKANSCLSQREDGFSRYMHAIPKAHRISTQHFLDTGIFHPTNSKEVTRQNPTLTGRGSHSPTASADFHYSMPEDAIPFTGWDYIAIKKNYYADSLPEMYTIYLSKILQKSLEKMISGQVKFHFILCDVQNIEAFLPAAVRYDRITTSNLWDYYPLAVLLTKFKGFLNSTNPHAVILTEAKSWPRNFMPEIFHELPLNRYGMDDLNKKALKDTRNPELVYLAGLSNIVEYLNLTDEFLMFLRTSLLVSCTDKELASFKRKKKIPSVKSLVASLRLHLRDFIRNENTVFPFKWALNCRQIVMMRGYERALEWKLTSDSAAEPAVE